MVKIIEKIKKWNRESKEYDKALKSEKYTVMEDYVVLTVFLIQKYFETEVLMLTKRIYDTHIFDSDCYSKIFIRALNAKYEIHRFDDHIDDAKNICSKNSDISRFILKYYRGNMDKNYNIRFTDIANMFKMEATLFTINLFELEPTPDDKKFDRNIYSTVETYNEALTTKNFMKQALSFSKDIIKIVNDNYKEYFGQLKLDEDIKTSYFNCKPKNKDIDQFRINNVITLHTNIIFADKHDDEENLRLSTCFDSVRKVFYSYGFNDNEKLQKHLIERLEKLQKLINRNNTKGCDNIYNKCDIENALRDLEMWSLHQDRYLESKNNRESWSENPSIDYAYGKNDDFY